MNVHAEGRMIRFSRDIALAMLSLAVLFFLAAAPKTATASDVAQTPLTVSTARVAPNLMFNLDDSGSMIWELTPDDIMAGGGVMWLYLPESVDATEATGYNFEVTQVVARRQSFFDDNQCGEWVNEPYERQHCLYDWGYPNVATAWVDDWYARFSRSPQLNASYYDPRQRYEPWTRSDGTLMPDADPEAAPARPGFDYSDGRNLKEFQTELANWCTDYDGRFGRPCGDETYWSADYDFLQWGSGHYQTEQTYWPAIYWEYRGDPNNRDEYTDINNYHAVVIAPESRRPLELDFSSDLTQALTSVTNNGHDPYVYPRYPNRTDCAADPCTYAEEIQNFANWYTYHRSRILAARGGIGKAFNDLDEIVRVGYTAINDATVRMGVRPFSGENREAFYNSLYNDDIGGGTPLRRSMRTVGEYFSDGSAGGPWSTNPGDSGSSEILECRQSFHILMTDGYWNDGLSESIGNVDGSDHDAIPNPDGVDFKYTAKPPFKDAYSNTLADMAMKYWVNDLLPDVENRVPTSSINPAYWQHLVTFGVGLGVEGTISPDEAFKAIETGDNIDWPDPLSSNAAKIDDLLHAAVNTRGGFFTAGDPQTFADELTGTLSSIIDRTQASAASVATNSTRLDADTMVYQARFNTVDWSGELLAFPVDPATGELEDAAWDAGDSISWFGRNVVTWSPEEKRGINFVWSELTDLQKKALNTPPGGTVDDLGEERLQWLRGDQSWEQQNGGDFRDRGTLLADIVHSSPAFVGQQDFNYYLLPDSKRSAYVEFLGNTVMNREPMLYVGANDGKLHGFNAVTGEEVFAYVPNSVFDNLSRLPEPDYQENHRFYVDETPRHSHAYINDEWRHILVGSLGAGGAGVFALDVTDPANLGPDSVLWELTDADLPDLGYTIGSPTIARTRVSTDGEFGDEDLDSDTPGRWVAIFGNGYESKNGKAKIYVVDLADGSLIRSFDTEEDGGNGMSELLPVDLDGSRITDIIVGGDLKGNLWRIDVRDADPANWDFMDRRNQGPLPMFKADGRPITVRPQVASYDGGKHMYLFGTGQYYRVGDNDPGSNPPVDTFYGVIAPGTNSNPGGIGNLNSVLERDDLQQQEILAEVAFEDFQVRVTSDEEVGNNDGWYLDLVSPVTGPAGERIISNPVLRGSRVIFTTVIPSDNPCAAGGESWLMEIDAKSGSRLEYSPFDLNDDGEFDESDYVTVTVNGETITVPVSGLRSRVGVIRTPGIISAGGTEYKYVAGSTGQMERIVERGDFADGRQSWRQLR
ncbi:pilus assembly protein [Natronospira bacteriovora]|uniref:PilC/PilY family type IV pilus protein n=1 Tax=Natronospira bacteriovora TaxID=3069753 RepID=A0ABU0W460_9GAMM|nr:PilC/PilY family type IV pilus protein [Natronospira sp. AB-CW4]MDQ2068808.1 PilC/PilY family type IV pilus protein [Natronospira sp. AB-CW4]